MFLTWEHVTDLLEISQFLLRYSSERGQTPLVFESKQIDSRESSRFWLMLKFSRITFIWATSILLTTLIFLRYIWLLIRRDPCHLRILGWMARWCGMVRYLWRFTKNMKLSRFLPRVQQSASDEEIKSGLCIREAMISAFWSGSNITNGGAIAHSIRERREKIQKYENPFDASKIIWMFYL